MGLPFFQSTLLSLLLIVVGNHTQVLNVMVCIDCRVSRALAYGLLGFLLLRPSTLNPKPYTP